MCIDLNGKIIGNTIEEVEAYYKEEDKKCLIKK